VALVGLWSLIAALAFSGSLLMWLVFADALALGVIALADLAAHEASTENVVHRLVVTEAPSTSPAQERAAA
jgi:predicted membrane protein